MPGKHNVVTVRTDQGKQKFQKQHLCMSLREYIYERKPRSMYWVNEMWYVLPRSCELFMRHMPTFVLVHTVIISFLL